MPSEEPQVEQQTPQATVAQSAEADEESGQGFRPTPTLRMASETLEAALAEGDWNAYTSALDTIRAELRQSAEQNGNGDTPEQVID
jgi:hypothetical protein